MKHDAEKTLRRIEMQLSGGLIPGELTMAPGNKVAFGDDTVPTVFLMDAEYDPTFVQFDADGVAFIFPGDNKWVSLTADQLRDLADLADEASEIWEQIFEDEDEGDLP